MAKTELTAKQERFCLEYLKDLNGTQAAIRAGYSKRTAQEQASRLLSKAIVAARVQELLAKRNEKLELKADDILRALLEIASVDIGKAYDANGHLLPIHEIPPEVRRAIAGIEVFEELEWDSDAKAKLKTGDVRKVKFWDKVKSLELLAKNQKLLTDRVEIVGGGMAEALKKARSRASGKGKA